jgi:hypothetical protein
MLLQNYFMGSLPGSHLPQIGHYIELELWISLLHYFLILLSQDTVAIGDNYSQTICDVLRIHSNPCDVILFTVSWQEIMCW